MFIEEPKHKFGSDMLLSSTIVMTKICLGTYETDHAPLRSSAHDPPRFKNYLFKYIYQCASIYA